jgi:hypothetical protein
MWKNGCSLSQTVILPLLGGTNEKLENLQNDLFWKSI